MCVFGNVQPVHLGVNVSYLMELSDFKALYLLVILVHKIKSILVSIDIIISEIISYI